MATRARQSTVEPTQRRAGAATDLPPYEKPTFPLNPAAQRALQSLTTRTYNLKKLDEHLSEAQAVLSTTAGEINDRLTQRERAVKKRKNQDEVEGEDGIERDLEEFRDKVERMTQRMDESMRKMIDAQHSVQAVKQSIGSTADDARDFAVTQATTQQARTQQYEDFQPTDPAAGTQDQQSPIELFKAKNDDAKLRYQSGSLTSRYADDNRYRDFRRVVHDARHPDGDVLLPHHSEWFEDGQAPAPGMTTRARQDEDEDSDVDIAVSRSKVSTKCPLTLAEFKKPLTSKRCPHSFESEAILGLIRRSGTRDPNRGGVHVHQCPVAGCSKILAADDLHEDAVIVRQIKRIQLSKQREQDEADEDDEAGGNGPTVIEDGDAAEDVDDIIEGRSTQVRVKREPRTQKPASQPPTAGRGSRATPMNIDDDDDDDDDETDEDEDNTMEE